MGMGVGGSAVVWAAGQCVVSWYRQQQQWWLVVNGVSCVVGCGASCGVLAIGVGLGWPLLLLWAGDL
jgi:hypothetical protein